MNYLLSMISDEGTFATQTPDEAKRFEDKIQAFNAALQSEGAWVYAEGLTAKADARTVRFRRGDATVSDGTASDAAEQSVGYWVISAGSIDQATDWARRLGLDEGTIEVRPLLED
jgi:hypothetical protein